MISRIHYLNHAQLKM